MTQRFAVYDRGKAFAVVHAGTAKEAIRSACWKTDGHDPDVCHAEAFNREPGQKDKRNSDSKEEE
jgi:hypothetical protein